MDKNTTNTSKRPTKRSMASVNLLLAIIMIALFLAACSNNDSPESAASTTAESVGETITTPDGATLPEEVTLSLTSGSANVTATTIDTVAAAPVGRTAVGPVYQLDGAANGQVAIALPADAGELKTLDLYGYDGSAWNFIPSQIDPNSQQIVSAELTLPSALALMQVAQPESRAIGAVVLPEQTLPEAITGQLSEVVVGTLTLADKGELKGAISAVPAGDFAKWALVTNVGPIIDQASLSALLSDPAAQQTNIDAITKAITDAGLSGAMLYYLNDPTGQTAEFTSYVQALSDALDAQNFDLAIALETPTAAGANWDTGGQNWPALGSIADAVYVQMPLNPTEFSASDEADQILNWATRQIDRNKLSALTTSGAIDQIGQAYNTLSNEAALTNFGELQFAEGEGEVAPGATVEVALSGTASPLEWDGDSLAYKYSYEKDGQTHNVWLGGEASLAHRAQIADAYNLRGVSILGLGDVADGTGFAAVFDSLKGMGEAPQPSGAAIVWTVRDGDDSVLASESGSELTYTWTAPETDGTFTIQADFALGDNVAELDKIDVVIATAETPEEVAEAEESDAVSAEEETTAVEAANVGFTGDADAVVNVGANLRTGPGLIYGTVSGGVDPGTQLKLLGRNDDASWYNIQLPDGTEAWIFGALITINSGFNVNGLKIVAAPPVSAPAAASGGDSGDTGAAEAPAASAPPPVAAAPVTNPGFELGGQTHTLANPQLMQYAGMNWVKFQHKWGPGGNPADLQGRIDQAHANGFKVLLSIPGTPYPESIGYQEYVKFLGGVAALGPDAIEVWNEMNIDFEWPAGQIDPNSYVTNMLAPAYNAIKGANPNVLVISGAPAPTGYFGGGCSANGCDDSAYLAGMAAAGAANYMDCMGAHFNAGATPPGQASGHPSGNDHYSWHFQPMLDLYYNTLGKPVCFTEMGYLSGEDFGGVPPRFSWAGGTSVEEHAAWLAQAVSLAASSGKVRMAIIFNVDFTQWGDDPQAGYAMIRANGGCPACESLRQVMGQ